MLQRHVVQDPVRLGYYLVEDLDLPSEKICVLQVVFGRA